MGKIHFARFTHLQIFQNIGNNYYGLEILVLYSSNKLKRPSCQLSALITRLHLFLKNEKKNKDKFNKQIYNLINQGIIDYD